MEELFEALLANPFLILIIVGGLISFFRGNNEASKSETSKPNSHPAPGKSQTSRQATQEVTTVPKEERVEIDKRSIDQDRMEQMNQLGKELRVDQQLMSLEPSENRYENFETVLLKQTPYQEEKFKKKMKKNVTKQGLVNGIIMAEVLGPPRSKKPYRNIVLDRNKY